MQQSFIGATYSALVKRFGEAQQDEHGHRFWLVGTVYGVARIYQLPDERYTEALSWLAEADADAAIDALCDLIRQSGDQPAVHVRPTRYEVCALPPNYRAWRHFALTVEYRGADKWAVVSHGACLDANGDSEFEFTSSNRDDEFLARFRFPLDEALRIAREQAPKAIVNNFTVADALANGPEWH